MHLKLYKHKVKSITTLMALTIEGSDNHYFIKYYKIEYFNSEVLIYMTTNQKDSHWNDRIIDTDFQWIPDFDQLVKEIENSEFLDRLIKSRFNSPPKYIYYDIIFIDDLLKPILLKHLQENISGYRENDLTKVEIIQINHWLRYLKSS